MTEKINGKTPEEITYDCMMYRLKRPNEWDEHCAGSLTLKGRVETAKWACNYIQQLERERDAAVKQLKEVDRLELFCCSHCKHEELDDFSCTTCIHMSNWEWIGAQEVE